MEELAILFRALQFLAHIAHHRAQGSSFFEDHEFFGELYGTYEAGFDALVERQIGSNGTGPDLFALHAEASAICSTASKSFTDTAGMFAVLLDGEKKICAAVQNADAKCALSQGAMNLLAGLADESEVRQYKIQQRIK